MTFKIKPKISTFVPHPLTKGWGILNMKTGELLRQDAKNRIERYAIQSWAVTRCEQLNQRT